MPANFFHARAAASAARRASLRRVQTRMPQVALRFAMRQLPVAEDRLELERDLTLIRETFVSRRDENLAVTWAGRITDQIQSEQDDGRRQELVQIVDSLAREFPAS